MSEDLKFYMRIPLPDGTFTDGSIDYNHLPHQLGLDRIDLTGCRALDIAANDGFWSFWAERAGSRDVLAIDVDGFEGYDWGHAGPPAGFTAPQDAPSQWREAGAGFWHIHRLWQSRVRRERMSIYDLDPAQVGVFDVVFNFGLVYHLRHPLLALDTTRRVCRGAMIVETHLINAFDDLPAMIFYRRNELQTVTNWSGPTEAIVVNWLIDAGYPFVFSNRTNRAAPYSRRIFVACIDETWRRRFVDNPNLVEFDSRYHDRVFARTRELLGVRPETD